VDSLALQRSLSILEDRYRELREIGQKHFEAWDAETGTLKQQIAGQGEMLDQFRTELEQKEQELVAAKAERDALAAQACMLDQFRLELEQKEKKLAASEAALSHTSSRLMQLVQH
jgi:SMC interacting uncharacterized protein involved in chromosome segregation